MPAHVLESVLDLLADVVHPFQEREPVFVLFRLDPQGTHPSPEIYEVAPLLFLDRLDGANVDTFGDRSVSVPKVRVYELAVAELARIPVIAPPEVPGIFENFDN